MKPVHVSIVIATYRRPAMLRDAVLSLRGMTVPEGVSQEVVVIDNDPDGSARSAAEELAPACRDAFAVRYVHETRTGLSYARNRGVEEARGDVIAFLDDDVYVSPGWLASALECFGRTGAAAVGGRTLAHWEGEPEAAVRASQRRTVDNDNGERDVELCGRALPGGGNAAFRREAFAGGLRFSTDLGRVGPVLLSGEDSELFRRLRMAGGRIWHCAGMVIAHRTSGERLTSAYLVRRHYWFGISYAIMDRKLHGQLYQATRACGRTVKALLIDLPRWAVSVVRRDPGRRLRAKCSLAKQCGYLRGVLSSVGAAGWQAADFREAPGWLAIQLNTDQRAWTMKILLCHNFYQQPGGEDQSFEAEARLLEAGGHDVTRCTVHNDAINGMGRLDAARRTFWNSEYLRGCRTRIPS